MSQHSSLGEPRSARTPEPIKQAGYQALLSTVQRESVKPRCPKFQRIPENSPPPGREVSCQSPKSHIALVASRTALGIASAKHNTATNLRYNEIRT